MRGQKCLANKSRKLKQKENEKCLKVFSLSLSSACTIKLYGSNEFRSAVS
jgi:hypothetical protein